MSLLIQNLHIYPTAENHKCRGLHSIAVCSETSHQPFLSLCFHREVALGDGWGHLELGDSGTLGVDLGPPCPGSDDQFARA
jgi:hypothetical protein